MKPKKLKKVVGWAIIENRNNKIVEWLGGNHHLETEFAIYPTKFEAKVNLKENFFEVDCHIQKVSIQAEGK